MLRVSDAGAVRAADRHHQHCLSLHGAGATRRDRARGRRAAGADAARFRPGDRRGRCVRADPRQRRDRAGARRRSRGARHRRLRRRLPRGADRGGSRAHRDLRRAARACRRPNTATSARASRSPARSARSRNSSRSRMRRPRPTTSRPAISGTAATSCSAPRCCSMNTARSMPTACRPSPMRSTKAGRDLGFVTLDAALVRIGQADLDRLCGDGEDHARRGGAGVLRLVRCRLLARGVGIVRQGRAGQRRAAARPCSRIRATATSRPTRRWSRWKASTISWWWRPRTPCWCRGRRTPTG